MSPSRRWRWRRAATVTLAGLIGVAAAAATTALRGVPLVSYHDEASYLLAADSFLHGRLANPTPRHPERFETFHVLARPTYASKYPPGQGLVLAAGALLGGRPIVGVWLSLGLMAAAITAMLARFAPLRWAFLGGVLAVVQLGFTTYWSRSYWGGAVAAAGGALLLAGAADLRRRPRPAAGLLVASGLAVLAMSRPYEGLVLAVVAGVWLVVARRGPSLREIARRGGPAALAGVAIALAGLALHNRSVTGEPLLLPHTAYARQVDPVPAFAGGSLRPFPAWRNDAFVRFYGDWLVREWRAQQTLDGRLRFLAYRFGVAGRLLVGPALLLPILVGLATSRRGRGLGLAAAGLAATAAAATAVVYLHPHYLAPAAPLLFLLAVAGLRRLRVALRHRPRARGVLLAAVLVALVAERAFFRDPVLAAVAGPSSSPAARAAIETRLVAEGGRHLVLVRLGRHADLNRVWVANGAEPESQAVLWGWSRGEEADLALLADYPDRRAWTVTVEERGRGRIDIDALPSRRGLPSGR